MRPEVFKTCDLMGADMAAIIQDHIERPVCRGKIGQKGRVSLIADFNAGAGDFQRFAGRIDVDKDQPRLIAEKRLPHRDGAAAKYTDLQKGDGAATKARQLAGIDIEIMRPFAEQALIGCLEVIGKEIGHTHAPYTKKNPRQTIARRGFEFKLGRASECGAGL